LVWLLRSALSVSSERNDLVDETVSAPEGSANHCFCNDSQYCAKIEVDRWSGRGWWVDYSEQLVIPDNVGGDRHSRGVIVQTRERERRALELWLRGTTYQQIADSGVGILTASGVAKAVKRALRAIPEKAAQEGRLAMAERLQRMRFKAWEASKTNPVGALNTLIKIEEREARLFGLDRPTKVEVGGESGGPIPITLVREIAARMESGEHGETVPLLEDQSGYDSANGPTGK
jgi:hypothetical protein